MDSYRMELEKHRQMITSHLSRLEQSQSRIREEFARQIEMMREKEAEVEQMRQDLLKALAFLRSHGELINSQNQKGKTQ